MPVYRVLLRRERPALVIDNTVIEVEAEDEAAAQKAALSSRMVGRNRRFVIEDIHAKHMTAIQSVDRVLSLFDCIHEQQSQGT